MVEADLTNNVIRTVADVDRLKDTLGGLHLTYNHLRGTGRTVAVDKDGGRAAPRVNTPDCWPRASFYAFVVLLRRCTTGQNKNPVYRYKARQLPTYAALGPLVRRLWPMCCASLRRQQSTLPSPGPPFSHKRGRGRQRCQQRSARGVRGEGEGGCRRQRRPRRAR